MAHVEVQAPAIQQKTAISRRFFVVAIVQVNCADMSLPEEVVLDLHRPRIGLALRLILRD